MKKILIALSLILSLTMVSAQPKNAADAQKAVAKAEAAAADAKKAAKPATWIAVAKAYIEAYEQPSKNILTGTPQSEVKIFLKDQKVLGTSQKKCTEGNYTVESYADKDLYYNEAGILDFYLVTKPALEGDMLAKAIDALEKAKAVDPKDSKAKDITAMMEDIHGKYANEALSEYLAGDFAKAAGLFKKAADCAANPLLGKEDAQNTYYCALVSNLAGNKEQAVEYYKKCLDLGFYQDGNTYSNLADVYRALGDNDSRKAMLEEGFVKFPENSGILVGLINLYMETNEDTAKLFDLLHTAQGIDPKNASLYYAEAEVYNKLKDLENAEKLYRKSYEVDNNYLYGMYGLGALYYNNFVDLREKASNELDDAKYAALEKQMEESLQKAVDPFEIAFDNTNDPDLKTACAEPLKTICFIFREDPKYMEKYNKYNDYLNALKGE